MCLLNIDQRNYSKIRFLQIADRKILTIVHEKKNRIAIVYFFLSDNHYLLSPYIPSTVLDAEDPEVNKVIVIN